jgi:aryl-alcohol dehydrogenase-like predicted oxidoreductase
MEKKILGKSKLEVTQLGLGCINFGTKTNEADSFKLLDAYIENGGNFIDTANNYAVWSGGNGKQSEETIGKWISLRKNRKDYILATKIGAYPKDINSKGFSNMQGLSRKVILEEVEKSLENLKTDYIDLLYLHVDDYETPQEETMEALNEISAKGLVHEIGCSNFRTWRIENARNICKKYNYKFFSAVQQRYTYLQPVLDADFFPQVSADKELEDYINFYKDITMVSHTSLLKGQYLKDNILVKAYDTEENREKLKKLRTEEKDPVSWVLKYITEQFGGSIALFTTGSTEHLIQNIRYFDK